jgi:hypothetical protein
VRTRRSQSGPFREQVYYGDHDFESICLDALKASACLPTAPSPVRIDRFVEKHFGNLQFVDLGPNILGCTEFSAQGVSAILISSSLEEETGKPAERRLRSTIAHEAGHGLLHAHLFADLAAAQAQSQFADWTNPSKPRILCREIDGASSSGQTPSYSGRWWEYQANRCIGSLLLPQRLFMAAVEPYGHQRGILGTLVVPADKRHVAVEGLADLFNVNPAVVRIRLEQLCPAAQENQLVL